LSWLRLRVKCHHSFFFEIELFYSHSIHAFKMACCVDHEWKASAFRHPLDPLSADEIVSAVKLVKLHSLWLDSMFFIRVTLHEPAKVDMLVWHRAFREKVEPLPAVERHAFLILRGDGKTWEAVVSLSKSCVESFGMFEFNLQYSLSSWFFRF
jgi:Cu2+-containing amine oxidase